ncbi:5-(carboxyamino)imidazole ribonucleotide mutase [Euzebya tangerina]|uniref:5-(carboxyamino)imidazole ribonucleotide mutase n=1 Tax=Euzebya tangerina TaxID=591198 RepID=UPI000E320D5F|nr:5-(carboxyamino)imidazole ribonucleotide mutase [Euzebya tangerina]
MTEQVLVGITMGSDSDLPVMRAATEVLDELNIAYEVRIVSAHRTPEVMAAYGREAADRGLKVLIAGAGGAAHLPGMLAAYTTLPVIGVPVPIGNLQGMDALLSIAQMPGGVPVATMAIGNAKNAGLLAARIIGAFDAGVAAAVAEHQEEMRQAVAEKDERTQRQFGGGSPGFGFTG